jgi:hypothetical protein
VEAKAHADRWRKYGSEVSLILWAAWDPIGAVPLDEYESYAPPVWRLLAEGASEMEIAAHLGKVRESAMGVGGPENDQRAAATLWQWWYWQFEAER